MKIIINNKLKGEKMNEGYNPNHENEINEASIYSQMLERSTELQKGVAGKQTEMYGVALLHLMQRSGDNTELVNSMRDFLNNLTRVAIIGNPQEPMHERKIVALTTFFNNQSKKLNNPEAVIGTIDQ